MKVGRHLVSPHYLKHRFLRALFAYRSRLSGDSHIPLLALPAVIAIDEFLRDKPNPEILEYGSGASTMWLARRASKLVSVEHDELWYQFVSERTAGIASVTLHLMSGRIECPGGLSSDLPDWRMASPERYLEFVKSLPADSFDLVLNDGLGRDAIGSHILGFCGQGGC
jgi:hypothetical protein